MATARSANAGMRDRGSAVPFRLLWLVALVIGVLVAHGARAENAEDHLLSALPAMASSAALPTAAASGPVTAVDSDTDPDARLAPRAGERSEAPGHPGHLGEHSHELCVSGHPQKGAAVSLPCAHPLTGFSWGAPTRDRLGPSAHAGAALPPMSGATGSVVQQV
ncbi:hypothetical protein ACFY12_20000 [Streptomyces sp. NPDC001339]|uniref:hypothetical protein n=1 Tax=Streptomyces sp. NPDC001339 TaxID=3364563 RepID=UPI003683B7DB